MGQPSYSPFSALLYKNVYRDRNNKQRIMRLFKIALAVSAVSAGDKYQATEQERKCLQDCKRKTNCQGQNITKDNVPELSNTAATNVLATERKSSEASLLDLHQNCT